MIFDNQFTETYQTEKRPRDGSQHGEEGIINEILKRLGISSGWIVDVGAWNGKCFSNTFQLVKTGKYKAIEIEAVNNKHKFGALLKTAKEFPNIIPINRTVSKDKNSKDSLDDILGPTDLPEDFEFLNLDTDAFDYYFWENLVVHKPKVVCIEFTPMYQLNDNVNEEIPKEGYDGSSFISIMRLGSMKGYTFVCTCGCNMFFVRNDLFNKLNLK